MKNELLSSTNNLLENVEGANLLLEYFAAFNKKIYGAHDFKSVLNVFYTELRKLYAAQHIEILLWQNNQSLVKFLFSESSNRMIPAEKLSGKNTLYNYILTKRQVVLTNNYKTFCENLNINPGDTPARSWLGIPMKVHNKVLGVLVIWDERPDRYFKLRDKQILISITNTVSFVMENIYLYEYIQEKNGSYKIFDNILPRVASQNSIKSVISQLLHSVSMHYKTEYTGLFLGTRQRDKWRKVDENFESDDYAQFAAKLIRRLSNIPPEIFDETDPLYWHEDLSDHILNPALASLFPNSPANSALVFPFVINEIYRGVWIIAFNHNANPPGREDIRMYRFISYVMVQLIEKRALLERNRKYESYTKHLEHLKNIGELASVTAHSLNNLLSVIIGKGQILQKKIDDPTYHRDLKLILQAALDGANSVRRLQDYSGRIGKEPQTIDMNVLVQEVLDIARPHFEGEAQSRGIYYDVEISLGNIKPIMGDAAALREVILNIINNALDAMPRGGKLSLQTTLKNDKVIVYVSDTGVGIPVEICDKIFEPFYTTKGRQGNGLGLSIAADIVKRHDGKIYVDSMAFKGAIFMIELPTVGEEKLPRPVETELFQELSFRVLLVENKGIVRETLAEMLEDEGCEVISASNAHEALLKFQKYACDVVFTDLSMPNMNGVELARRLKKLKSTIPVFIVTGWNKLDDSLANAGDVVDGIIRKPFTVERIRHEMLRVIGKYKHFHKNGFKV
jgi:signal transduction histidine kinase/ActR/RegA family two-component response regulator